MSPKKAYLLIVAGLVLLSCSEPPRSIDNKSSITSTSQDKNSRKSKSQPDPQKLIITEIKKNGTKNWSVSDYENVFELSDTNVMNEFDRLLAKNYVSEYFNNIPEYSLLYFCGSHNCRQYRADTSLIKDTVILFNDGFQFHIKIAIRDWNNLLQRCERIQSQQMELFDLNSARKILEYCDQRRIPIILDGDYQDKWPDFDGEFQFNVTKIQGYVNEKEIYNNIKTNFPDDRYEIKLTGSGWTCSCPNCKDCKHECTFTIYCDQKFYDKFNLYQPKSWFDEYYATFKVLGTPEELEEVNNMTRANSKKHEN